MKKRWSMAAFMILAGLVAVSLALSPSAAVAKEFKYAGPPAFTVTYPGFWTQDVENPNKALLRTKQEGSLPIMEIFCKDIPAGATMETIGKEYQKVVEKSQQTTVTITSDNPAKLKDGTPCREVTLTFLYQGFLNLQCSQVGTIKDGKWVYVTIYQNPGAPLWDVPRSIMFKK